MLGPAHLQIVPRAVTAVGHESLGKPCHEFVVFGFPAMGIENNFITRRGCALRLMLLFAEARVLCFAEAVSSETCVQRFTRDIIGAGN